MRRILIALLIVAPLHAQPFQLPSLSPGPFPSVRPLPPTTGEVELQRIIAKAKRQEMLTEDEFMTYIRELEDAPQNVLKRFTWGHLISKLHYMHYSKDVASLGWMLFTGSGSYKEGPDNSGYMDVDPLISGTHEVTGKSFGRPTSEGVPFVPSDIVDRDGHIVEIRHAYAGARAACNQTISPFAIINAHVNLGWGDEYQQDLGEPWLRVKWLATVVKAGFKPTPEVEQATRDIYTTNYKPEKQTRGNTIGMWLWLGFVFDKKQKLSDAFTQAFKLYHEGKDPHVFGNNPYYKPGLR